MENIDLTKLPKVWDGYKRQWYKCDCGKVMYMDYIPYSLSNPIITTPCGHDLKTMKKIDESEVNDKESEEIKMKLYEIEYDLPHATGNSEIVLAEDEDDALAKLEKKDTSFKNIGGYFKVHNIKERPLEQVRVSKLSVAELLLLMKEMK